MYSCFYLLKIEELYRENTGGKKELMREAELNLAQKTTS